MGQTFGAPAAPPTPPPVVNPGKFDDIHRESKVVLPETFEGFRCEFTRQFGEQGADILVSHVLAVAPPPPGSVLSLAGAPAAAARAPERPESYTFAAQLTGQSAAVVGRFDSRSGAVFGTLTYNPVRWVKAILQAHVSPSCGSIDGAGEVDVRWQSAMTQFKAQGSGVIVASHMHGINNNVAVGLESLYVAKNGFRNDVLGLRVTRGLSVLAGTLSLQARELLLSYAHRVNENLVCASELHVSKNEETGNTESLATVGWQYSTPESVVRGRVNSKCEVGATIDEAMGILRVSLSADANFLSHVYKWGFGVSFR
eukprot:m51a1_g758 hypothetical protein (313) ;mRNA; f:537299-538922